MVGVKQILLAFLLSILYASAKDLYAVLGLGKSASKQEIKKAYRQKAKDTHPDKNPGIDTETAAEQFREIAEAYEILSDEQSRRRYDQTGRTGQSDRPSFNRRRSSSKGSSSGGWNFGNFWNFNQQRSRPGVKYHRFFLDYYSRRSILNAQSRVLTVTGWSHFEDIALDDFTGLTERYVLLAIYDSRVKSCEDTLNFYMMYPWPFAGLTNEGSQSMWWEETMITTKIDLGDNTQGSKELQDALNVDFDGENAARCPTVAFFPRGTDLKTFELYTSVEHEVEFREFVWQRLRMQVTITNRTPWTLSQWWLDGVRGMKLENIPPDGSYVSNTFLSHSFVYRADFVEGRGLNNQSSVFWYTSRMADDRSEISIYPRCFDHHSDCSHWARQGFCDATSRFSRHNMDLHDWASKYCHVSCSIEGCGSDENSASGGSGD